MHCLPLDDPNNQWNFCPSIVPAYIFAILFGVTTIAHISQGIIYRKWYTMVVIMGGIWQTAAFIFRIMSINNQAKEIWYTIWFILILVAPLWINAFVYMVMGRMVYNFLPKRKTFGLPAHRFGLIFVLLDIFSFFVQIGGASMASGDNISTKQMLLGIHIYMVGIGIQQVFIFLFLALAIRFQLGLTTVTPSHSLTQAKRLLYILYAVLLLITIRIIFRLIEYSKGLTSTIPSKEGYMYSLDSLPMLVCLVLLNVMHPGRIMSGKESDLPSRKERKLEKKYNKLAGLEGGTSLIGENEISYPGVSLSAMEIDDSRHGAYDRARTPSPFEPSRRALSPPARVPSPYDPVAATYTPATGTYTDIR